jgi:hypothetical protein
MYYLILALFALSCLLVLRYIVAQFKDSFDWFSASLYAVIFLVSCGLLYILFFLPYYLLT